MGKENQKIDLKKINDIQVFSQAIMLYSVGEKLIDFLREAFRNFPETSNTIICFNEYNSKYSNEENNLCGICNKKNDNKYKYKDCLLSNEENIQTFKIQTSYKFIGIIAFTITNPKKFKIYAPFIQNFINLLSYKLENDVKQKEIEDLSKFPEENNNPVLRMSFEGKLIYSNKAGMQFLKEKYKYIPENLIDLLPEHKKIRQQKIELEIVIKQNDRKYYLIDYVYMYEKNYINIYAKNITEQKNTEKKLFESKKLFEDINKSLPGAIYQFKVNPDNTFDISFMSISAEKIFEKSVSELMGKNIQFSGVHPDDVEDMYNSIIESKNKLIKWSHKYRIIMKNKNIKWIHSISNPHKDSSGGVIYNGVLLDITKQKEDESKIRQSLLDLKEREKIITALFDSAKALLNEQSFEKTAKLLFNHLKEIINAKSGYVALLSDDGSENDVLFLDSGGLPCDVNPYLPMPIRGLREKVYKSGKSVYDNDFMKSKWIKFMPKGHVKLKNVMFVPLNLINKTVGIIGIANKDTDFTENDLKIGTAFGELAAISLKKSYFVDALKESEHKFKGAFNSSNIGMAIISPDGKFIDVNNTVCRIFNYSKNEILKLNFQDITHPDDLEESIEKYKNMLAGEYDSYKMEKKYIHKNGQTIWGILSVSLIRDAKSKPGFSVVQLQEISLRKKTQEQLKALWGISKIQDKSLKTLTEYTLNEMLTITESKYGFYGFLNEDESVMRIYSWSREALNDCKIHNQPIDYPIEKSGLWGEAVRQRKIIIHNDYSMIIKGKKGLPDGHVKIKNLLVIPVFQDKKIMAVGAVANKPVDYNKQDIEALDSFLLNVNIIFERKKAEEKIIHSLEEKEILLKEIHHRVKNNMQVVSSILGLQILKEKDKHIIDALTDSKNRIKSIALVHENLYQSNDFSRIDLQKYIESFIKEITDIFSVNMKNITFIKEISNTFLTLEKAIPCALIINELITNCYKHAFPDLKKGKIILKFYRIEDVYHLEIKDNGIGIPVNMDLDKSGTLGMQIVGSLVKQLDGELRLKKNIGTVFMIEFPIK